MNPSPRSHTPEPLFAWVTRESSVDTAGNWEASRRHELVIDAGGYVRLLQAVGAKSTGLLVSLALLSQADPQTGQRFVEGSQEALGKSISGGDAGWSGDRTREALDILITAGLLEKVKSRPLGRSRGSSAPRWFLSPALFAVDSAAHGAPTETPPRVGLPIYASLKDGTRKTTPPKTSALPPQLGRLDLGVLNTPASHAMEMDDHFIPSDDDNDALPGLLSVAVIRELSALGWINPESTVSQTHPGILAAWIVDAHEHARSNPGGFIRSQSKKPGWPFYPPGWDVSRDSVIITPDGHLARRNTLTTSPPPATPPLLTVAEILRILEESGHLGNEVHREWISTAEAIPPNAPSEQRSSVLRESGTALLKRYNLLPPDQRESA